MENEPQYQMHFNYSQEQQTPVQQQRYGIMQQSMSQGIDLMDTE